MKACSQLCSRVRTFPTAFHSHNDSLLLLPLPVPLLPPLLLPPPQFLLSKGFKTVKNVSGGIAAYSQVDRAVPEY